MQLFISRNKPDIPKEFIGGLQELGISGIFQSFLEFEFCSFELPDNFDAIFFASKTSVDAFLASHKIPANKKIYCAGKGTEKYLQKLGLTVNHAFVNAGEISDNSKLFRDFAKGETIFFPLSSISRKSYSGILPPENVKTAVAYKTILRDFQISDCEFYVFTSPSNAEAFLKSNFVPDNAVIISWGESTSAKLRENSIPVNYELKTSGFPELLNYLQKKTAEQN